MASEKPARDRARAAKSAEPEQPREPSANPVWFLPIMLGLMLVGVLWVVVYTIFPGGWPVPAFGQWNTLVGLGIMFVGFMMTTRWR